MSMFFPHESIPVETLVEGHNYRQIKAHDPNLMMVEVIIKDGGVGAGHSHPHHQVTYILEGEFEFYVGDETRVVRVGDSLVIPGGVNHGCRLIGAYGRVLDIFTPWREDFLPSVTK